MVPKKIVTQIRLKIERFEKVRRLPETLSIILLTLRLRPAVRMVETRFVSQSAGALSTVNHLGLYHSYRELKLEPENCILQGL